ncbi:MAG: RNA-binding S4 domain-containing protein [Cognaticolwellia sp.]
MTNVIPLVDISVQPIELCKLLKIANMVGGGGEAKIVISEGYVLVNNEVEFQKRKKIYHHDIVEFNGEVIQVNLVEPSEVTVNQSIDKLSAVAQPLSAKKKKKTKSKNTIHQPKQTKSTETVRAKRKPISF